MSINVHFNAYFRRFWYGRKGQGPFKELKSWRGRVTCLRPCNQSVAKSKIDPEFPASGFKHFAVAYQGLGPGVGGGGGWVGEESSSVVSKCKAAQDRKTDPRLTYPFSSKVHYLSCLSFLPVFPVLCPSSSSSREKHRSHCRYLALSHPTCNFLEVLLIFPCKLHSNLPASVCLHSYHLSPIFHHISPAL